jgi:hypothetical protein
MSRWLVILVLVFVPLQLGWAAVAAYCAHEGAGETGVVAQHLGHHEHQHQPSAEADPAGVADLDCSHCHGHGTGLPMVTPGLSPASGSGHTGAGPAGSAPTPPPAPPERPQWARLA